MGQANGTLPMQRNAILSAPLKKTFCCPRCDGLTDQVLNLAREAVRQANDQVERRLLQWAEGVDSAPFIKALTGKERRLFQALWVMRGMVMENDAIHRAIYGEGVVMSADLHRIRVLTSRLRSKITPLGYRLMTVTAYGLRLDAPAEDTPGDIPMTETES